MLGTEEGRQSLNNMTKQEVIEKYKLTDDEVKNGVIVNGKTINIDSFIAGPTTAVSTGTDVDELIKKHS